MNEVSYYPELASSLEEAIKANLSNENINIQALYLPTFGNNIRDYLDYYIEHNKGNVSNSLIDFSKDIPKVRTDTIVLFDNPTTDKFTIVIVEVKLLSSAGLSEFSQLIGYNLVTKIEYGILVNVGGRVSTDLNSILISDADVTKIERIISTPPYKQMHKIGVMSYNPTTKNLDYIETLTGVSIPKLVQEIENKLS